jgi:hypothetical protein
MNAQPEGYSNNEYVLKVDTLRCGFLNSPL